MVSQVAGERDQVKVLDFGIAQVETRGFATKLTQQGFAVGTPMYMAPEQITGTPPISGATDLYALGCIMYECLTGRPPFPFTTNMELFNAHVKEPPPPLGEAYPNITLPPGVEELTMWLLRKKPSKRPESAQKVREHIDELIAALPRTTPMPETPPQTVAEVLAGGAVAIAYGPTDEAPAGPEAPVAAGDTAGARPAARPLAWIVGLLVAAALLAYVLLGPPSGPTKPAKPPKAEAAPPAAAPAVDAAPASPAAEVAPVAPAAPPSAPALPPEAVPTPAAAERPAPKAKPKRKRRPRRAEDKAPGKPAPFGGALK